MVVLCFNLDRKGFVMEEFKSARVASIGLLDTNMYAPSLLYSIPSNDDSFNSVAFYCDVFMKLSLKARTKEALRLKRLCKRVRGFFVRYFFRRFALFLMVFEKFFSKLSTVGVETNMNISQFSKWLSFYGLMFSFARK
jgi:hypothetical protein